MSQILVKIIHREKGLARYFAACINQIPGYRAISYKTAIGIIEQPEIPDIVIMDTSTAISVIGGEGEDKWFIELVHEEMPDTRIIVPTSGWNERTAILEQAGFGKKIVELPSRLDGVEEMVKAASIPD